ncbi:MAG: hypothetical protein K2P27_02095, partial [Lachnospiraceae bacterium]|nr:hypothetical protein [Lachnospiraceae bacterium]
HPNSSPPFALIVMTKHVCLHLLEAQKREKVTFLLYLFPRATSQVAACRHLVTAARSNTPLLAVGYLILHMASQKAGMQKGRTPFMLCPAT